MLYLYVLLILLSETAAISLLKKFSMSDNWLYFGLGLVFYTLVAGFLVKSFRYGDMGVVNVLWSAFSILLVVTVGILYFKEHITLAEVGGISMILAGVVVLKVYGSGI